MNDIFLARLSAYSLSVLLMWKPASESHGGLRLGHVEHRIHCLASPPVSRPRKPGWKPNTCILNKLWNEWCSLSWDHNLWTTHLLSRPKAFFFFFFFFCKMALAGSSSLTLFKTIFLDCIVTVLISPCIKNIYISKLVNFCVAILVSKMQEKTAFFSIVCFIISRKVKKAT